MDAFWQAFDRHGAEPRTDLVVPAPANLGRGRRALAELIDQRGFEHGVVFASSDLLAHGLMVEAQVRGIAVPDRIAVIGFGDQDFASDIVPALTSVRIDRPALGRAAARAILGRFDGVEPAGQVTDLGLEIVQRKSA